MTLGVPADLLDVLLLELEQARAARELFRRWGWQSRWMLLLSAVMLCATSALLAWRAIAGL